LVTTTLSVLSFLYPFITPFLIIGIGPPCGVPNPIALMIIPFSEAKALASMTPPIPVDEKF